MRVDLQIDSNCEEPHAVLHVAKLTPSIQTVIEILEKENDSQVLTAQVDGRIYVIEPMLIDVIRTEGREVVLYDRQKRRYILNKPIYEMQEQLGKSFVRISKSAIVNVYRINHLEAAFNGTMEIIMKNGIREVITRSFRQQFKERLGV